MEKGGRPLDRSQQRTLPASLTESLKVAVRRKHGAPYVKTKGTDDRATLIRFLVTTQLTKVHTVRCVRIVNSIGTIQTRDSELFARTQHRNTTSDVKQLSCATVHNRLLIKHMQRLN